MRMRMYVGHTESGNEDHAVSETIYLISGGSLGLFIGFSFFALWDIIKDCATVGILSAK